MPIYTIMSRYLMRSEVRICKDSNKEAAGNCLFSVSDYSGNPFFAVPWGVSANNRFIWR